MTTRDRDPLVAGNNAFAFDLYHAIKDEQKNIIFSPYSISQALAMVYLGARGETKRQMADVLHFTLPHEELHPAFNTLHERLNRSEGRDYVFESELNIANAIWGQQGYPFHDEYLSQLDRYYHSELHRADFANAAEEARLAINAWISEATEARIQDLLHPDTVFPLTRLILANAVYFKAGWLHLFSEDLTQEEPFTLLDGGEVAVDMMGQPYAKAFAYGKGRNYQVVRLEYQDQLMSMLLILPDIGAFEAVEAAMNTDLLHDVLPTMRKMKVNLSMPRFEAETILRLEETLAVMGMPDAFGGAADFSGIADPVAANEPLMINQVIHRANITVDEKGTEATAATVVGMYRSAGPRNEPIEFRVDRPFLYFIESDGTILFMGRVPDPTSK